jgi:hypothetical protein
MKTRRALEILSQGAKVYSNIGDDLYKKGQKFIDMYEERERQIIAQKNMDKVPLPFLTSIQRKVAKMVDSPDNLPVIARFDLYTGIRKISERSPQDGGLKRLSAQLEKVWTADPLGALTYSDVNGLVNLYKDQFPRSKAADAIEAECSRSGLHKLPVAKLARIAANINSQEDYNSAMEINGYAGNRPEQIKARILVRELVAMKGNVVDSGAKVERDLRTADEKVSDRLMAMNAQLVAEPPIDDPMHEIMETPEEEQMEHELGVELSPELPGEAPAEGVEQGTDIIEEIEEIAEDIVQEAPPEAMDYVQTEQAEGNGTPGTAEWGFAESQEGHEAPPPSPEWVDEELQEMEHGGPEQEMGLDLPPPGPGEKDSAAPNPDWPKTMACPGCGTIARPGYRCGCGYPADMMIPDPAKSIKGPAAPSMLPDNELTRFAKAPPGKEKQVLKLKKELKDKPGYDKGAPFAIAWDQKNKEKKGAKGKGIPLPEKIVSQPNAKSLEHIDLPKDGGKVLKASEIETSLLNGNIVRTRTGSIRILINANNEVELWDKTAGRACGLLDLDVAIADFINLANYEKRASIPAVELVDVPCEVCAQISQFPRTASLTDQYGCSCGNMIDAAIVDELINLGQLRVTKHAQTGPNYQQLAERVLDHVGDMSNWEGINEAVTYVNSKDPSVDKARLLQMCQIMAPKIEQMTKGRQYIDPSEMGAQPGDKDIETKKPTQNPVGEPKAPAQKPLNEPEFDFGAEKHAQATPAVSPPPAPAAPGQPEEQPVTDMPVAEVIKGAFVNYKAQGMSLPEALRTFFKEHADLVEQKWSPDADAALVAMQTQYFTANTPAMAPPVAPGPEAPLPAPVASIRAQKLFDPAIRKPKDHISVGKQPLGKDTQGEENLPTPGKIKTQQGKPDGKLSDTSTEPDTDGKEITLAKPSKTSPTKGKLPNKDMGKDSEPNEAFRTPKIN